MNENAEKEDQRAARELLLPLARGLSANWKSGNRREAGVALSHITNSGHESAALVSGMSRVLKKVSESDCVWSGKDSISSLTDKDTFT